MHHHEQRLIVRQPARHPDLQALVRVVPVPDIDVAHLGRGTVYRHASGIISRSIDLVELVRQAISLECA